ncbi:MAG: hypothetical protein M0025_01475 [Elusimicrobia bacterium]|nr:hypothetical protein [Elusimicrobiota bacterium]
MPELRSQDILDTCERLLLRIRERFPKAALAGTCEELRATAADADRTAEWISRPEYLVRGGAWLLILLLVASLARTWSALGISTCGMNVADFFQMIDAGFNTMILLGAAGLFLMTFETRRKRRRVIQAVNRLRCLAHIIDAHQLTKDPHSIAEKGTEHSPRRELTPYELGRYLDYCSEMLSVAGKIAFLYIQRFDDAVATDAVNDLEALTIGISQKVWQKILLLQGCAGGAER